MNYIKQFQKENGLKDDGVIGKKTITKFAQVHSISLEQASHVLGQCGIESKMFKTAYEDLRYTVSNLLKYFKKYFTPEQAEKYSGDPVKIANRAYANRNGNGNEASGDGWRFRGRGGMMLTGRKNYQLFSDWIGDPEIMINPDIVAEKYFWETAIFYFKTNGLFAKATKVNDITIMNITKAVNGGYNHLKERTALTYRYYTMATAK